jgi:hypothetical protein
MVVVPMSYLPPQSQQWGRSVDERIGANNSAINFAAQEALNAQKQLESSIQRLSSFYSVADVKTNSNTVFEPGSPSYSLQAFNASVDPSVSIVANTGKVIVSVSAVGELNVPGTGLARGYFHPECVGVDTIGQTSPALLTALGQFSSSQFLGFGTTFQRVYILNPGTYTFRLRRAVETGGSSTGMSLVSTYRAITAQVIP